MEISSKKFTISPIFFVKFDQKALAPDIAGRRLNPAVGYAKGPPRLERRGKPPPPLNKNFFQNEKNTISFNCHNMTFKEYIFELQKKDPQFQACLRAGA